MFVHSSRFRKQIDYLQSLGIDPSRVYALAGIDEEKISDPQATFPLDHFITVLSFAIEATGDDYYGLKMGQEPHIAGTIGVMSASCQNLKQAFIQGCRYFQFQGNFADIEFIDDPLQPRIIYRISDAWLIQDRLTARHEVDAMFSFLASILAINSHHTRHPNEVRLTRETPEDDRMYKKYLGVKPNYRQKENEMIFSQQDLLQPMKAYNPEIFEILKSHVEEQLRKFAGKELVSEKVRAILLSSVQYTFPDMETVSSRLNMSSRTLQRMLARENTNFKTVLQDTRIELAKRLLGQEPLTVSEIAYTLGYSDLGNFSRSFKKLVGMSPLSYKNQIIKK